MNDKQVKILKKYGYDVFPSINYIRNKNNDYPTAYIEYDNNLKSFNLNLLKTTITNKQDIKKIEKEILSAFDLIQELYSC